MSKSDHIIPGISDLSQYRPDIDGLRAIAVLLVVFFHAFPKVVLGGFIGVDVFFVISGFLITGILLRENESNKFSFAKFYARRARRILPALLVVLIFTLIAGLGVLFSQEYKQLAKHVAAGLGFVSNFALWNESGYFDSSSDYKPLLHLWSLSIEEQYYFIWPVIILFGFKRKWNLTGFVFVLGGLSLALNLFFIHRDPSMTFYFPFTRIWEIFVGSLLAIHLKANPGARKLNPNAASLLGLLFIGLSLYFSGHAEHYPDWSALLPTVGAFLIIYAGAEAWANKKILSHPAMVLIGLISYPLYLWHWPLLVYARIASVDHPTIALRAGVVVSSILLAWLTYKFLETPVRTKSLKLASTRNIVFASLFVFALGLYLKGNIKIDSYPESMALGRGLDQLADNNCAMPEEFKKLFTCHSDLREDPTHVVWGDSKADALFPGLLHESTQGNRWSVISRAGCSPVKNKVRISFYADDGRDCAKANAAALESLMASKNITTVALVIGYRTLFEPQYGEGFGAVAHPNGIVEGLASAIEALQKSGKQVVFVLDNPTLPDPRQFAPRRFTIGENKNVHSITLEDHKKRTAKYAEMLDVLKTRFSNFLIYDPTLVLCDSAQNICPIAFGQHFLYSYDDHLSDYGNRLVAKPLLEILNSNKN